MPPVPWGPDWHQTCLKYLDYLYVLYMVALLHPGFQRALPDPIQLHCAERVLYCLNLDNLLLASDLVWESHGGVVDIRARLLPVMIPAGYRVTEISNE